MSIPSLQELSASKFFKISPKDVFAEIPLNLDREEKKELKERIYAGIFHKMYVETGLFSVIGLKNHARQIKVVSRRSRIFYERLIAHIFRGILNYSTAREFAVRLVSEKWTIQKLRRASLHASTGIQLRYELLTSFDWDYEEQFDQLKGTYDPTDFIKAMIAWINSAQFNLMQATDRQEFLGDCLRQAVICCDWQSIGYWVEAGADVDFIHYPWQKTPLLQALSMGDLATSMALIQAGADLTSKKMTAEAADEKEGVVFGHEYTALEYAESAFPEESELLWFMREKSTETQSIQTEYMF